MKKLLSLSAVLLILASCKKQYTCECTTTTFNSTTGATYYSKDRSTYKERTREKAQNACVAKSAGSLGRSCVIIN